MTIIYYLLKMVMFILYYLYSNTILHMVALNNLKIDKGTKSPVNPVIHSYYTNKCKSKKKNVAIGAVMHKICNIIFAMLRDNKPFKIITPHEHCEQYLAAHPDKARNAA